MKDALAITLEYDKQMLTMSTAVLTLTVGFIKDILKVSAEKIPWQIKAAWLCNFISIGCGIGLMQILATAADSMDEPQTVSDKVFHYERCIPFVGGLQCDAFALGMFFILLYGVRGIRPNISNSVNQLHSNNDSGTMEEANAEVSSEEAPIK